jgi:hypothetical protein
MVRSALVAIAFLVTSIVAGAQSARFVTPSPDMLDGESGKSGVKPSADLSAPGMFQDGRPSEIRDEQDQEKVRLRVLVKAQQRKIEILEARIKELERGAP